MDLIQKGPYPTNLNEVQEVVEPLSFLLNLLLRLHNHCGWRVPWDSMAFVAGKYYKNMKPSDKYVQKRWVKKVYGNKPKIHGWHLPDLVVVEFEEPFNMVPGVIEPACLPTQKVDVGTKCFVSGWGRGSGNSLKVA